MAAGVQQWQALIDRASRATGIPASIIAGVMRTESGGRQGARSYAGAQGLMQVMPFWFKRGEDAYDPWTNILKGATILSQLLKKSGGDWNQAFARYNGTWGKESGRKYAQLVHSNIKALGGSTAGLGSWGQAGAPLQKGTGPGALGGLGLQGIRFDGDVAERLFGKLDDTGSGQSPWLDAGASLGAQPTAQLGGGVDREYSEPWAVLGGGVSRERPDPTYRNPYLRYLLLGEDG